MQKLFVEFTLIRLVTHWKVYPRLFINDGFVVRKRVEAVFTVIRAHSAFTYSAKAHSAGGKVYHNVIYTTAAVRKLSGNSFYAFFIACKKIQRKRLIQLL